MVPCASHNLRYILPSLLREGLRVSLLCLSFLSGSIEAFEAEFADLDGLTEFEVGDVDIQTLGDGGVNSLHLEFADAGSELTTGLDTFCEAIELDGHFHHNGLLVGDLIEVNVEHVVLHGVELSLLEDGEALLAINVELNSVDVGRIEELAELGAKLIVETLPRIEDGSAVRTPQDDSLSSYAPMVFKEEGIIDFSKSARQICCLVRGLLLSVTSFMCSCMMLSSST